MRKLASIQQIADVQPIVGADAIVKVRVNDWWCVAKVGEFKVGDLCVYHEIDCLLPMNDTYAFLAARGTSKSELEDGTIVEGYRLKTIKLRGQLSQGLALPVSILGEHDGEVELGTDVTEVLSIHKYERPMNAQLRGVARGNFPSFLRKSDQERCQNLRKEIWDAYLAGDEFQVTVKLDGSSMTMFNIEGDFATAYQTEPRIGVCSRNLELKETEENAFWKMARNYKEELEGLGTGALQGELISPSIQGNFEGVDKPLFLVYNVYNISKQCFAPPYWTEAFCDASGFKHVPVLHSKIKLVDLFPDATQDTIIQKLLDYAEGPSSFGGKYREGVVFKRIDGKFSFKAISNRYLISEK